MHLSESSQKWRSAFLSAGVLAALLTMHFPGWLGAEPDIAENRTLADKPPIPGDAAGWNGYPKAFDAYVQDRFPARTRLIQWINYARYALGDSGSSRVIVGRDGWLFYDDGSHLGAARAEVPLRDVEANRWLETFAARTERLANEGIPYFILVPPVKERVYTDKTPRWFVDGGAATDAERLRTAANRVGLSNVIYLLPELRDARKESEWVYSRFDTHWSSLGAHRGYLALAKALSSTKAAIPSWSLDRYRALPVEPHAGPRDLALMLGIAGNVVQHYPQHDAPQVEATLKTTYLGERHDWTGPRLIETGRPGPTLLLTVDSFSNTLLPFLYPHVSRLIVSHNQDGYFREDLIRRYKPDVVITEVLESGVRHAMTPPMDRSSGPLDAATATIAPTFRLVPGPVPNGGIAGVCNLEVATFLRDTGELHLEGWAFDESGDRAGDTTIVAMDFGGSAGHVEFTLQNAVRRDDVAGHFGKPSGARAGFSGDIATGRDSRLAGRLSSGGRIGFALIQHFGAQTMRCPFEQTIDVR